MFAKIDSRIFSSSLIRDPEQTLVFIYLNVLADADGAVDMDYESIAATTRLPVQVIISNIDKLMRPDPKSRRQNYNGARLIPLDPNRPTGWRIVNKRYYRERIREQGRKRERRGYMRELMRKRRAAVSHKEGDNNPVSPPKAANNGQMLANSLAPVSNVSQFVIPKHGAVSHLLANVSPNVNPHKDQDTDMTLSIKGKGDVSQEPEANIVQHTEAKIIFGKLSDDVFGKPLRATQWPNDLEHWLDEALPMKADDLALLDWFYRLPPGDPIFKVTLRRQSMRALIENVESEVQKVKSALRLLDIKKSPAEPEPEEKQAPEWTNERMAATRELFPGVSEDLFSKEYTLVAGDVRAQIETLVKKTGGPNGS